MSGTSTWCEPASGGSSTAELVEETDVGLPDMQRHAKVSTVCLHLIPQMTLFGHTGPVGHAHESVVRVRYIQSSNCKYIYADYEKQECIHAPRMDTSDPLKIDFFEQALTQTPGSRGPAGKALPHQLHP
jgi:hypothetical protein